MNIWYSTWKVKFELEIFIFISFEVILPSDQLCILSPCTICWSDVYYKVWIFIFFRAIIVIYATSDKKIFSSRWDTIIIFITSCIRHFSLTRKKKEPNISNQLLRQIKFYTCAVVAERKRNTWNHIILHVKIYLYLNK